MNSTLIASSKAKQSCLVEMSKSAIAVVIVILITGLIAGMFFGIGIKTGVSPDEGSMALMIMKSFCQATEGIGETAAFNCLGYLAVMTLVIAIVGIADVFAAVATIGDWRIGLTIYGVGWFIGLMMIVAG